MDLGFRMHAERTPTPNSVKWVLSAPVAGEGRGSASFEDAPGKDVSPLAARLFSVAGVVGVFLGPDFVTISKEPEAEWTDLAPPIVAGIKEWVTAEEPALGSAYEPPDYGDEGDYVRTYITRLRRKLEADPKNPRYILSEWGFGYRLTDPNSQTALNYRR